jgi:hypothetical protein
MGQTIMGQTIMGQTIMGHDRFPKIASRFRFMLRKGGGP